MEMANLRQVVGLVVGFGKTLQPLKPNNGAGFGLKVVGLYPSKGFSKSYRKPFSILYSILIFLSNYSNKPYNPTTMPLKLNNGAGLSGCRVWPNPWKPLETLQPISRAKINEDDITQLPTKGH
jgi:hypothetical protein